MMKTKQDNYMIDGTSVVYAESDNEVSWPIGLGAICVKNQKRQQRDRSYKCSICQKWC